MTISYNSGLGVTVKIMNAMRLVENIPGMRREVIRRMMEGVNLTMIYYKNVYKCHNVPPVQQ
jgi:hypothetical protein